ncbi:MAG: HD-GYP domain-containing protein [Chloroflexi bacterium]|nr:MAG: HD-GYP domain-containing protein [Chloroflexota bacterium]TME03567.1 MAG: HD-GYP domain-containing protein [Chloroflexota bacterium]TME37693.1 MAG: HD-GYP domain-containing protein [Chloroflexota bacterium]TME52181.1 MAG: HD-GYP domain-containing protein [Chloroflexota bacterium]
MPVHPPVQLQIKGWFDAVLALGLKVKDREARGHNLRVARLCVHIGRQMSMSASELRVLARAGLMHDIGKLGIPEAVLEKHSPLDESEWILMRAHPEMGLTLLDRAGQSSREVLAVLYHHERLDGSGYPYGLKAESIPIEARIVAVADTYDALTSDRPYRKACSPAEARRVLVEEAGSRLDPNAVAALFGAMERSVHTFEPAPRAALAF